MKKSDYIPSITRLTELVDDLDLSLDDRRHLHRVKNWLRNKEDVVSSAKLKRMGL